jgi:hypothetical protein
MNRTITSWSNQMGYSSSNTYIVDEDNDDVTLEFLSG